MYDRKKESKIHLFRNKVNLTMTNCRQRIKVIKWEEDFAFIKLADKIGIHFDSSPLLRVSLIGESTCTTCKN